MLNIVIITFLSFMSLVILCSIYKKTRLLTLELLAAYFGSFIFLFGIYLITLWYIALPLNVFLSYQTYQSSKKAMAKTQSDELLGAWSATKPMLERQIKEFKYKSSEEQQKHIDYCISHPKKINLRLYIICSIILPILILATLILCGLGYRWNWTYPIQ